MHVTAAEERHPIEDVFLERFEREINHRCDVEGDQLRDNEAANDDQAERAPRSSVSTVAESKRHSAHQRSQRGHDNRTETFDARFVDRAASIVTLVEAM